MLSCIMAAALTLQSSGPSQRGAGAQGQYVYALIMPQPSRECVAQGIKQPSDLDRDSFREMVVKCHSECDIQIIEVGCFKEPHGNGDFHLNLLVRVGRQYRWKRAAERYGESTLLA